jgi:hypothetical protein
MEKEKEKEKENKRLYTPLRPPSNYTRCLFMEGT